MLVKSSGSTFSATAQPVGGGVTAAFCARLPAPQPTVEPPGGQRWPRGAHLRRLDSLSVGTAVTVLMDTPALSALVDIQQ